MTTFIAAPFVGLAPAVSASISAQAGDAGIRSSTLPVVDRRGRRRRSIASTVSLNDLADQEAADVSLDLGTPQADTEVSCRVLTDMECRSWISNHDEGLLGYQTGRGPRAVVVSYAVTDDQVVSRVPEYNEIGQYLLSYCLQRVGTPLY